MNIKFVTPVALLLLVILTGLRLHAQSGSQTQYFVPQQFPRSPSAAAIEKYGSYQVNEFTGIPDISIPLYTIQAGSLSVPITLSYHASGNKVSDVASWVGLGWSVSSGGQVTRATQGLPDDAPSGYLSGAMKAQGTINYATEAGVDYLENASNGQYDTKPDIYSYDFPGHAGKFFYDGSLANGTYPVRMLPYAPLQINYTKWQHFYITDEHGDQYLFGDAATDTTTTSSGGGAPITTQSAWKVKRIMSQNRRDTITFSYQRSLIDYPQPDGDVYTVTDLVQKVDEDLPPAYTPSYNNPPAAIGSGFVTTEQDPAQINFKNGKVVFTEDDSLRTDVGVNAHSLKKIQIYGYNYGTKTMELQKSIVFYKSYFTNSDNSTRLRLDSIQVQDKAGNVMQRYSFGYNTATALPGYTSAKQDYWGYYNNAGNTYLTPKFTIPYKATPGSSDTTVTINATGGATNGRDCDSTYMQAFILNRINYPTGGYSTFTYQTNQYYNLDTLKLAGGLRIKTISSYDGINPTPIVKTYVYHNARPNFNIWDSYFYTTQMHKNWTSTNGGNTLGSQARIRSFNSIPHAQLEGLDGATVVYPAVTEYIGTSGTNIGKTEYTFTDAIDSPSSASNQATKIYISTFYRRGHLQSKKEFMNTSSGYWPVKYEYNTYTAFPPSGYYNVGLEVFKTVYNEGNASNPWYTGTGNDDSQAGTFVFNWYNISSDDNYLVGTSTYIYDTLDSTKYTTSAVNYNYDNIAHQQVTRAYHTDSKGNTHVTRTKYPADYPAGNAIIDTMVARGMQAEAIEKYDTLKNVATSTNAIISAQLNQYKTGLNNAIVPSAVCVLNVVQPLTNFVPSTVSSGVFTSDSRYTQMISFDAYDANNNLTQYTARNATPVSILWNYLGENPVAQAKNTAVTNVLYTSFEADNQNGWTYSGTPLYDATAPSGFYSYPLSAGSITGTVPAGSAGYVLSYWSKGAAATVAVYGTGNISGTAYNTVNGWTYYEHILPASAGVSSITVSGSTSIDELRAYPAGSQMTTYAYDPSGVRAIMDTKGTNSYFEYDYFQRLKNAKDWAGNIVKNYSYHYYNQTVASQQQSAVFTRNNCPAGYTPGSLTYTVPAGRYYGQTQASANADAIYDMDLNGQIKANTNCSCTLITQAFTLSNSTGISGFQATFSGIGTPYNFPSSGSTNINIPPGTYTTISVNAVGSATHTFSLTGQTPITGHSATFNNITITTGTTLTLSIN